MEKLSITTCMCFFCILKTCDVLDIPRIEGGITGKILEFNCSSGQIPLGQTVEIVTNGVSQFTIAHFNTTCIKKHVICKPSDCFCTSNWFQWTMEIENPTIVLKVQCLMRYPENKRNTFKATIAFNGSYFWDYSETLTIQEINVTSTTEVSLGTSEKPRLIYTAIATSIGVSLAIIFLVIIYYVKRWISQRQRRNTESALFENEYRKPMFHHSNGKSRGERRMCSSSIEMNIRERTKDHNESTV